MIEISLNNHKQKIAPNQKLDEALILWGFHDQSQFAVAVNQSFVPRAQYAEYVLAAGDEIDIVHAINGG
jgi:sulfur carrier protein